MGNWKRLNDLQFRLDTDAFKAYSNSDYSVFENLNKYRICINSNIDDYILETSNFNQIEDFFTKLNDETLYLAF